MAKVVMTFKNILVPYDASPYSGRAFRKALDIAKTDGSKIVVFTLIEGEYSAVMGYSKINPEVIKKQRSAAMKYISNLKLLAKNANVPFTFKIQQGTNPVKEIVKFTASHKCDLIVMGSHGKNAWNRLILGSVANGVVQRAKAAVMVVR